MKPRDMKKETKAVSCYYQSYRICSCNQSEHCDNQCVGAQECEHFISENDYFLRVMEGKIKPADEKKAVKSGSTNAYKNLALGKSKKALKREAKLEDEKNQVGSGFSIKDDPRFKDLFGNK